MKSLLAYVAIIFLFFNISLFGQDKKSEKALVPESLKVTIPVQIKVYSPDSLMPNSTMELSKGDSIFIFDGELYFRARANGREFFIARSEIMPYFDSLVVYQNYRLVNKSSSGGVSDTVSQKVVRQCCTAITKDGARCQRLAPPGQTKCWQHKD
jgi:hypothetical protein